MDNDLTPMPDSDMPGSAILIGFIIMLIAGFISGIMMGFAIWG